jgi:hypothetical protein
LGAGGGDRRRGVDLGRRVHGDDPVLRHRDVEDRAARVGGDDEVAAHDRQATVGALVGDVLQAVAALVHAGTEQRVVGALAQFGAAAGDQRVGGGRRIERPDRGGIGVRGPGGGRADRGGEERHDRDDGDSASHGTYSLGQPAALVRPRKTTVYIDGHHTFPARPPGVNGAPRLREGG